MGRVRVLAMDHFFDQDLRALEAHPDLDVRRFPYQRLRNPALRIMTEAISAGLRGYNDPRLRQRRLRYAAWLRREVRRLFLERAFDVLVLPSDTFFYVRALPVAVHELGIPVVVVQKETTISADTMKAHSRLTRDEAPFIADFMTVCSNRQREFWLRAGADASVIEVTGQPRFDVYASRRLRPASVRKRVLFLSYELDAYVPEADHAAGSARTWETLRDATESVLLDAVRAGSCDVVVKCHPQQNYRVERARLARHAGQEWNRGVSLAGPNADTRDLILASDCVVGFQTTAIYEAVAASRPVVFAAWGEAYDRLRGGLIPFYDAPPACVSKARSAAQLATLLAEKQQPPSSSACAAWYEEALGSVDGGATERVAARLQKIAADWRPTAERRLLERRRRSHAVGLLVRSFAAEAVWTAAVPAARLAGQQHRVEARRCRAREGRWMAMTTIHGG
ncbi:MAG: CDP-glycerol glycerophosphotransferase family protein [Candidatus Dormibacteraeota bacterium]|uniref:CDP-glycerol glycerophosphotransferase family protein n=1 Tax=Candidatus Aeolococcus gillhamiae TaxID=3127015 RepID=A0A2W5Z552_9BACT|nr:CDP-glycerol glycerophosphotransferase family protein [Candidatus Dormibacteraeota bacterium]PZR80410.1 MAG: hypothetical protein DLM65_08230 [Candidatus Dormibacter sp. RRmetagenome_bin12]